MRFNYSGYTGSQNVSKHIDLLNANEFAKMFMRNPGHDKTVTLDTTVSHASTDWQNTVFRSAPIQSHDLRVSGSNGGTNLMAGASLFQQDGIITNSRFNRGSVRFNLDQQLGSRVNGRRSRYLQSLDEQRRSRQRWIRNRGRTGDHGRAALGADDSGLYSGRQL